MRKIHCTGCGMSEPLDMTNHKILTVTMVIDQDIREWANTPKFETDLCPDCRGRLFHNYFDTPAEGSLEIPAFIEPRSLKAI